MLDLNKRILSILLAFFVILTFQNCTGFNVPGQAASSSKSKMGPGDAEPIEGKPNYDYRNPDKICAVDGSHLISRLVVEDDLSLRFLRLNCQDLSQPQTAPAGSWKYGAADKTVILYKGQNFILEGATDPCLGQSPGAACADGNGNTRGYYIGSNQGSKYMITPSLCDVPGSSGGCWDVTHEVQGVFSPTNGFTGATTPDGLMNSWILETIDQSAAQRCRTMDYGGFTDWYLPSASEMLTVLISNAALIPGLGKGPQPMWSSTELNPGSSYNSVYNSGSNDGSAYVMVEGGVILRPKTAGTMVRCIRRF